MTTTLHPVSLTDRYELMAGRVQLTGIQALARLVVDQIRRDRAAGRRVAGFISGYEGSPLGGLDLELMRHRRLLDEHDLILQPGLNEELAATSVEGSQLAQTLEGQRYDGVVGVWYGKSPGLDRATDALRHANLMGTAPTGGVLCLVGDDPAAKSSSIPGASELALADLRMPILYPADSQEILDLGLHGIALSRASGLWASLKIVTAVADASATVELDDDRVSPILPDGSGTHVPTGRLLQPVLGRLEEDQVGRRIGLAAEYGRLNGLNRVTVGTPHDTIGIVAAGKTYLDVREALTRLGLDDTLLEQHGVRLLKLGMPYPLHPETVRSFARGLREIVVVEEKRAFVETALKDLLYDEPERPSIVGKSLFPEHGELDADLVLPLLARVLRHIPEAAAWTPTPKRTPGLLPLLKRAPYFCSGCPHNSSTRVPEGTLVGAGIGCHAMVLLADGDRAGDIVGLTQMGGEGAQWIGMEPFLTTDHLVQNLGDGTFHHSGSLAVRAAVAAGSHITFKLLHNGTVAMTGGQDAVGAMPVDRLVRSLLAEGVSRVIVTTEDLKRFRRVRLPKGVDVWDRSRLDEAQQVLAQTPGTTVLVHDQECAAQKRRRRRRGKEETPTRKVVVNERICEGCGDCGRKSNCLSVHPVETEYGRKTRIHQSSCNSDYTCLEGDCPSFMVVTPGVRRKPAEAPPIAADSLPLPPGSVDRDFTLRVSGIGGTGVVTVSAVLATAALIAGRHARSLDQTGLAQKGGAVVSDLKVTLQPSDEGGKVAAGCCDVYLVADPLAGADEKTLSVASPGRTYGVVSTALVPTGPMVADVSLASPDEVRTVGQIADACRPDGLIRLDARALSEQLFGDDQYANSLLVGAALQAGALPLPPEAVEAAITLNAVEVERNLQAFRRGRQYVADPEALLIGPEPAAASVDDLVASRRDELTAYQSAAYAREYAATVGAVRDAEERVAPGSTALTDAVARNLFKLMAYKDEYEVARLATSREALRAVEAEFGEGARVAWKLHPPALRALGLRRKLTLGAWFRPVLRLLCLLRFLRGTPFDPFGRAEVRRVERRLVKEYRDLVLSVADRLDAGGFDHALRLAELPDLVRGYEHIKLKNVERYDAALRELISEYTGGSPATAGRAM